MAKITKEQEEEIDIILQGIKDFGFSVNQRTDLRADSTGNKYKNNGIIYHIRKPADNFEINTLRN